MIKAKMLSKRFRAFAGKRIIKTESPMSGSFGLYQEENATDRRDWNRKVN